MLVILLTILLVLLCAYDLSVRSGRVWRMLSSQFPGEPAQPLIGNMLQLGSTSDEVQLNLHQIWNKLGRKNFRIMFGMDPMLMVCDAEDAKLILGSNVEIQKSDQHINITKEHFGDSLVNSIGERWRIMRKILTPSFHFKLLDQYLNVANSESNILIEKLRPHVDKPAFDIHHDLSVCTMNVVCRASMGISVNNKSEDDVNYIKVTRKILPLYIKRFYSAWYRHDFIYKRSALGTEGRSIFHDIETTIDRIIAHRRREEFDKNIKPIISSTDDVVDFISKNRTNLTFIDVMLLSKMPNGLPISNEYIREETNLMVFAGYDTTVVTTLSFTLCNLAKYKELQEKAYEEQLEIFGDDLTREATSQDLNNMKYLQRFIKESLRMYPTLAQFGRHINNDLTLNDGKVIPAGTSIVFYIPGLHMNAKYFPDPEKFDPDRFLQIIPIYTYLPFSAGPRNCIVLLCAYDLSVRSGRVWRMLSSQFPGEPALPLIGNMLQLGSTSEEVQRNLHRIWAKHERKNFRVVFGTDPILFICEQQDAKIILSSNVELQKSQQQLKIITEHFGQSLINASGERWRTMRKILTPSFHFKMLEQHLEVVNTEGNILIDNLKEQVDEPAFDIFKYLVLYTMDVICSAVMGINVNSQTGGEHKYIRTSRRILPLYIKRFYSVWYRYDFIYKNSELGTEGEEILADLENTIDHIIAHRREEFDKKIKPLISPTEDVVDFISKNRTNLTFIDVMLLSKMPDGSPIPHEYIREETNLMVFAGYDTTLTTICFTLSSLAKYKQFQDRAYQEQLEIFSDDLTREPNSQDLANMKYLQRFIKETMRHYPVVSQFSRNITNDLKLHDGKVIPAGTNVMFHLTGLHMNPDYFPDPEKFNPDRFLQPISSYTYLPFSAGPRNCIGMNFAWMSMRSTLSKILRNFELSLETPEDEPRPVAEFILKSTNGHRVKLIKRKTY